MTIPKQDLINALPIRWAFHVWYCGRPQWVFQEWRDYLIEPNSDYVIQCIERFVLGKDESDPSFPNNALGFLTHNRATTLAGFIRFWLKCCREYKALLENS